MVADALDTNRGRITAHLLCLGRSLRRGRLGSLGFFCAGIWRELQMMRREAWQSNRTEIVK